MVSVRSLALAASTLVGLAHAVPTPQGSGLPPYTPGTLNNTQEFHIVMKVTAGPKTYNNWYRTYLLSSLLHSSQLTFQVQTYHTGAGMADPVFFPTVASASRAFLNGTNLQFDASPYPFAANGAPGDTNYARWEPITVSAGYGQGAWVIDAHAGLIGTDEEFAGWLVCEWYHGTDAPQLFQWIKGFAGDTSIFPSSCSKVNLIPKYF